jgi:hypothetical protein
MQNDEKPLAVNHLLADLKWQKRSEPIGEGFSNGAFALRRY